MNNKSSGSRHLFPSYRDQEFSRGQSQRYLGMPDRLSYGQILRSRSTISFDRGRPYDSPTMLQENDSLLGRGRNEGRYGRDSLRLDTNRPDLPSRSFRTDPDSQFNPLYPERDILERERLAALRNRNLHMSEDSGSSFHRSRPMDTPVPTSYREPVPDVDILRKKFENHIRNEMMELSQELPPSRFGLRLGNTRPRQEDLEVNKLPLGSRLRNSQPLEVSSGKSIAISSSDPPVWDKDSHSKDSLWNTDRTSTEFLGGKEKAPYPVGVRIKDIPPENSPWDNERAQYSESRLKHDGQSPLFPVIKDSVSLKVLFAEDAMWKSEAATQSVALQTKSASPQLSLEKTSTATILSTGVEPNDLVDDPEPNNNPNNPVYSDAYISNQVSRQSERHNRNSHANSTEPTSEDNSQKFAKEDPIPFDQYPAYSIPFLGETVSTSNTETDSKSKQEDILNQVKPEDDDSILSNSSHSKTGENDKMKSTLEDALETLMLKDPIVGLDYIIEYKDIVSSDGGFPFYCNLCKSSISRSLIIDHVKGFKHGLKYLKIKNENASEYVLNHVKNQTEKEEYVYKAMEHLEQTYGKGHVVVKLKSSEEKQLPLQIRFGKVPPKVPSPISELEDLSVVEPLTLAKIDEISQDFNQDGASFINEENSSCSSQQNSVRKECEGNDDANPLAVKVDRKVNESEEKAAENVASPSVSQSDIKISSVFTLLENKSLKRPSDEQLLSGQVKIHKPEVVEILDSADDDDGLIEEVRLNNCNVAILDKLTQCSITNDEEANVVKKTVEILLKLLLQYNLRHIANEDRMRLISEVQSRPFQTMEKLQELLKLQSQSGAEDVKLRLNSDFSIRGKNLAFSPDNAAHQPTVSPHQTKPPVSTAAIDSSTDPLPSRVQPQQPLQHHGLSLNTGSPGNVNHPPSKVPLLLPNSLLGIKPPPPPPENPIPPPPALGSTLSAPPLPPLLGSTLSAPPPPPPLPPEPPLCKPPLPPSQSKTIPMPPHNQMNSTLLPPPPMAPAMGSSTFLPNPYQMYAGHIPSAQSKQVLLPANMMPSVGGMMVPPTGNMLSPHFMPMPTGILPDQSRQPNQTQGLLPNPVYPKGAALLPSHRYTMRQHPRLPPS